MNKIFKVKYGSIYKDDIMYDNIGVIIDKKCGLLKYGDSNKGIKEHYENMINKYRKADLSDIADDIILLEFDRYNGILSIEEISVFLNYMVMCSANGESIIKMTNMSEKELHNRLQELSEFGY